MYGEYGPRFSFQSRFLFTDLKVSSHIKRSLKNGNLTRLYTTLPYRTSTETFTASSALATDESSKLSSPYRTSTETFTAASNALATKVSGKLTSPYRTSTETFTAGSNALATDVLGTLNKKQNTTPPIKGGDLTPSIIYKLKKSNSGVHDDRQNMVDNTGLEILNNSKDSIRSGTKSNPGIEPKLVVTRDQNATSNQSLEGKEKTIIKKEAITKQAVKDNQKNDITEKKEDMKFFGSFEMNIVLNEQTLEPYCAMESHRHKYLLWPDSPSDLSDWEHKRQRKCPKFIISDKLRNTRRLKYSLTCSSGKPMLQPSVTNSSNDVDVVTLNSTCLAAYTNSCCNTDNRVPNVVHYVWYFKKEMMFQTFLSIISVVRFVRPCLIIFHGEYLPYGTYWDYIIRLFPNILHVKTDRPLFIYGRKISHHEHSGDVMRIEVLKRLGGIYLDTDVIVLRDLKRLRYFNITMCRQSGGQFLLNSFIMSRKNATFLTLWQDGYKKDYRNNSYVYNSMQYNNDLARSHPDLIHIEIGTMCCPDILVGVNLQSSMIYDWSKLYGFHIYSRQINFPWDVNLIRHFNTTFGAMLRHVIYGNKELCF